MEGGEGEGEIRPTSADFAEAPAFACVCFSFPPLTLFCSHAHTTHYRFGNRLREPNRAPPPPDTCPPHPPTPPAVDGDSGDRQEGRRDADLPLHVKQYVHERSRSFVLVALAESNPLMESLIRCFIF